MSALPKSFTKDIYIAQMLFAKLSDATNLTVLTKEYSDYTALKSPTSEHLPPHNNRNLNKKFAVKEISTAHP